MEGVFGLAGGLRRRPTTTPIPPVPSNTYYWFTGNITPPKGRISGDKATPSSITHLYVSTKGHEDQNNSSWLAGVCANMYDLAVELRDDPNCYAQYRVTAVASGTDVYDFTVTYLTGSGDFPIDGEIFLEIIPVPNAILTAKGDLLTRSSSTPVKRAIGSDGALLVADASQSSGLNWLTFASFWFGTGNDSSSTLGSNTTLADNLCYCRNYTTLDLVTFTLQGNNVDVGTSYMCSVLLTGNGGSILPCTGNTINGGASRTSGTAVSGAGGTAGGAHNGLFVFARKVSGTVTVNGNGITGGDGGNATGVPAGILTGNVGAGTTSDNYFNAASVQSGAMTLPTAAGAAGGGAGSGAAAASNAENNVGYYDCLRYFLAQRVTPIDTEGLGGRFTRGCRTPSGSSGGSGALSNTTAASGGGGGGGSFSMADHNGVSGGAGGAGGGTIGVGGGGGGGASPGTFVGVMVGEFAAGTSFTVSSNGGNGGNGGNGAGTNGGGGGGGAGGNGGIVFVVFPVNYASVTTSVTASAGSKGLKGLKAGAGTDGNNGNDGNAGTAVIMTWLN